MPKRCRRKELRWAHCGHIWTWYQVCKLDHIDDPCPPNKQLPWKVRWEDGCCSERCMWQKDEHRPQSGKSLSHEECKFRFEDVAAERYDEENWWEGSYLGCFRRLHQQRHSLLAKGLAVQEASLEHNGRKAGMPEGHFSDWDRNPGPREVSMKFGDIPVKKVDKRAADAPSPSSFQTFETCSKTETSVTDNGSGKRDDASTDKNASRTTTS